MRLLRCCLTYSSTILNVGIFRCFDVLTLQDKKGVDIIIFIVIMIFLKSFLNCPRLEIRKSGLLSEINNDTMSDVKSSRIS